MGVPAFFRWLSKKYASLVVHCVEQKGTTVDDVKVPVDTSEPNPNDTEFDNLYLDMNGIIHPCCHPEDKPAPKNEDEMMELIFEYIDRIFSIVRPRQLLYMAIDGVAPRAKMNQQRSRRFRASKESVEKREDVARIKEELRMKGCDVLPDKPASEHFDSNCITPGTPFMFRLADCLRYYVHDRLNNDPGWRNIKVILSDANVPGEGEHKIMDYIRRQRAQPDHNPNTHHCLCGADADLIMLGLATHEPNFTIIREEFKPNQPRPCDICGQMGHEMKECSGAPREKQGEHDELEKGLCQEQEFIFLRLCVLREYLTDELTITGLPFKQDIERAIDDWVFMCFFVGNDFLPHLPSLQIREGAIDRLIRLYKDVVLKTGGYLTENGFVNQSRVQLVLSELGGVEDEIFKTRRESDLQFKRRNKEKRKRTKLMSNSSAPKWMMQGSFAPQAPGGGRGGGGHGGSIRQEARDSRVAAMGGNQSNSDAAASLRSMLDKDGGQHGVKRKNTEDDDSDPEPEDDVKLWEDGWKGRYYQNKFAVSEEDTEFRHHVANEYVLGLCWVLQYYYQGCPSWKWYYPFHYAPFASDFVNIGDVDTSFEKDTEPFKPLEQLMGVFPAASKEFLPPTWQPLMEEPESAIIDFYPIDFRIDLNGKKYAWQGVALLPFVDEKRLWAALDSVYPDLTDAETKRNIRGSDRLFVGKHHASHAFIEGMYEGGISDQVVDLLTKDSQGMGGKLWCDTMAVMAGEEIPSPVPQLEAIHNNQALSVHYHDPEFEKGHVFSANILPGAKFPDKTLKPQDLAQMHRGGRGRGRGRGDYRPQLGFQRNSGYRGRGSFDSGPASRNIRAGLGSHSNVAPPLMAGRGSYGGSAPRGGGGGGYGASRGGYNDRRGSGGSGNYQQQGQRGRDSFSSYGGRGGGYGGGHHGGGGGGGSGGGWQQRNQTQSYQQNQQRGYQQGGYQQGGGYQQRGGGSSGGGYQSRDGGGYDSYSTRRGSGPHQQRYDRR